MISNLQNILGHRCRNGGALGARAPPSFQSVPCLLVLQINYITNCAQSKSLSYTSVGCMHAPNFPLAYCYWVTYSTHAKFRPCYDTNGTLIHLCIYMHMLSTVHDRVTTRVCEVQTTYNEGPLTHIHYIIR